MTVAKNAKTLCVLGVACILTTGCVKVEPQANKTTKLRGSVPEVPVMLLTVVDLSSSFYGKYGDRVLPAVASDVEGFARSYKDSEARLVICQLSGEEQTVLWEGDPGDFRREYPTPNAFKSYLEGAITQDDQGVSPVYRSIENAIQYALDTPGVTDRTAVNVFVHSDLLDTGPDLEKRREHAKQLVDLMKACESRSFWLYVRFAAIRGRSVMTKLFARGEIDPSMYTIDTLQRQKHRVIENWAR